MASLLRMPGVSADADEAVLNEWTVAAGAKVREGDVVAAVETEKAVVDIVSDQDATVHTLLVDGGTTVPVGDPIAVLLGDGEPPESATALLAELRGQAQPAPAATGPEPSGPEPSGPGPAAVADAATPAPAADEEPVGRVFASPLARRLARENELSIEELDGTGPGGRIVRDDVRRAIAARQDAPVPAAADAGSEPTGTAGGFTDTPHTPRRRLLAGRLTASKQQAPHFYLRGTVRVDRLLRLREQVNEGSATRVSLNDFFVKAAAKALVDVPEMNVIWTEDAVRRFDAADVGVAIAGEKGLVTPVVRAAETLSITGIAAAVRDLAARADAGRLRQHELEGGSLTVSNLGMYGVESFDAIINPPQAGILAVGAAQRQPVVSDEGEFEAATVVSLTLSVDHRPVDGVLAARWLARLRELVENPLQILA